MPRTPSQGDPDPQPPPTRKVESKRVTRAASAAAAASSAKKANTSSVDRVDQTVTDDAENIAATLSQADTPRLTPGENRRKTMTDNPLRNVADFIRSFSFGRTLDDEVSKFHTDLIDYIGKALEEEERNEKMASSISPELNRVRKAVKADTLKAYDVLSEQMECLETGIAEIYKIVNESHIQISNTAKSSKAIEENLTKVTDTADKLANASTSYRDALLAKPTQAPCRANVDPKVLGDMERRARQLLIETPHDEGPNAPVMSLSDLVKKANDVIDSIDCGDKPAKAKAESVYKTRNGAVVFTFDSKDTAIWLRDPLIEDIFTEGFAKDSYIRSRNYTLIVPRVPTTLDTSDFKHIREIEEANGLDNLVIGKVKWIKPLKRRRLNQTHAIAKFYIRSAEVANKLIRDGLTVFGTRVRPYKQKQEPVQCMKCRLWGHFASECTADQDTCGTCGGQHRTSECNNPGNLRCASCKTQDHVSWDRNCPEFLRRCSILDERNPENAMPYFPMDEDWSMVLRPPRIALGDRFPAKFAVNSLPIARKTKNKEPRQLPGPNNRTNPNTIPIPNPVAPIIPTSAPPPLANPAAPPGAAAAHNPPAKQPQQKKTPPLPQPN